MTRKVNELMYQSLKRSNEEEQGNEEKKPRNSSTAADPFDNLVNSAVNPTFKSHDLQLKDNPRRDTRAQYSRSSHSNNAQHVGHSVPRVPKETARHARSSDLRSHTEKRPSPYAEKSRSRNNTSGSSKGVSPTLHRSEGDRKHTSSNYVQLNSRSRSDPGRNSDAKGTSPMQSLFPDPSSRSPDASGGDVTWRERIESKVDPEHLAFSSQTRLYSVQWHPAVHNQASGDASANAAADRLVRAAAQGQLETIQRLLEGTPRLHVDVRSNGKTALQVASHQGHTPLVRFLLRAGACVNVSDTDGDTCLHYAAFGNQPEVLDLLIKSSTDLNAANRSGCTALHMAALKQPARCAQLLLAAGSNPNNVDLYDDGDTALHDAIGKDCLQATELLCMAPGTDFTLRNKRGFNVLHHAALKGKNLAIKKLLSHARQLVDVKKDDGFSAVHLAALNGHKNVVDILIRVGRAEIDLRNNRNQTALLLAVSQGKTISMNLYIPKPTIAHMAYHQKPRIVIPIRGQELDHRRILKMNKPEIRVEQFLDSLEEIVNNRM